MDMLLLAITIISLGVALVMGIAARRASRAERARSAARVAALAAAAVDAEPVAVTSATPAAAAPPVEKPHVDAPRPAPWNAPPEWRRLPRSVPHEERRVERASVPVERATMTDLGESFLGSAVAAPASGGRQRGLAIAACVLFAAVVSVGYVMVFGGNASGAAPVEAAADEAIPLELISLRHERQKGALAITGLVRNPTGGRAVEKLNAVVFLFDQQGTMLTSSRAGVDFTQLTPGDESPFVIRMDAPANVARYRVSFRTDAGVVPHVDRRGQEPIARDLP